MTTSSSDLLADAFSDALELEPSEREAFLDIRLAGHADALAEAKRLIALHEDEARNAAFLARPPAPAPEISEMPAFSSGAADASDVIGQCIGPYRILDTLGEGGMGVVYLAEQETPIRRMVAIKIIKPGMDSRQVIARFQAEVEAQAMLDHPNIARVIDAGQIDDAAGSFGRNRPYLVMEYIAGPRTRDIRTFCDERRLMIKQRLELVETLCHALQHSHSRGVIHRDIKPSNVLVTDEDSRPRARIIDFGVAKAVMPNRIGEALTQHGQFLGTLEYLSPEQASSTGRADAGGVDARTDIYSLGVLAYELIAGVLPLDPASLNRAGEDPLQVIRTQRRPNPSDRFADLSDDVQRTIAQGRRLTPQVLRKQMRGDLDSLISKAIEVDRERRYASAADMAEDIHAFLAGRPITAARITLGRRLVSLTGSLAIAFVAPAVLVLSLVLLVWGVAGRTAALAGAIAIGVFGAMWGVARSVAAATEARRQRDAAERLREESQRARVESDRQHDEARQQTYVSCMIAADAAMRDHAFAAAKRRLAQAPEALRKWEWFYLRSRLADRSLATLHGHGSWVAGIACSRDGRHIASASRDATIGLWNLSTGEAIATLRGHDDLVQAVAFTPDGAMLVSGSWDRTVALWDVKRGALRQMLRGHNGWIATVAVSPDGRVIASGCSDGCVRLWNAVTGELIDVLRRHSGVVYCLAFSPDSATLASGGEDTGVHLWNVADRSHQCVLHGHTDWVRSAAFSPDGAILASAGADSAIKLWDVRTREALTTLRGHRDRVYSVAFSPDGTQLASGSSDSTIGLWNITTHRNASHNATQHQPVEADARPNVLHGHDARVFAVAFAPDGKRLVSGSEDATIKIWNALPEQDRCVLRSEHGPVFASAYSPDGHTIAIGSGDKSIDLWRAASEQRFIEPEGSISRAGVITLWNANTAQMVALLRSHTEKVSSVAFSPDGTQVASASYDRTVKLWKVPQDADGQCMRTLTETAVTFTGHAAWVFSVAFSPDGRWLASGGGDRTVRMWDLSEVDRSRQAKVITSPAMTFRGHFDRVNAVAFSRSGHHIASGSSDGTVKLWDIASGKAIATLRGHKGWVLTVAFSPDGRLLATGSSDNTIRLWNLADLADSHKQSLRIPPLVTLRGHSTWVFSIAFSPDGSRLASGSWDNTVKLWDTVNGEELATLRGHTDRVNTIAFSPDGSQLVSGSWDQTIRLWRRDDRR